MLGEKVREDAGKITIQPAQILVLAAIALSLSLSACGANDRTVSTVASAQREKAEICHNTGSKTNPWVAVRVSGHAVPAHYQHGDFTVDAQNPCPPESPPPPPPECPAGCANLGNGRCESVVACAGGAPSQGDPAPLIAACGALVAYTAAVSGSACAPGYHSCTAADLQALDIGAPAPDCDPFGLGWINYNDPNETFYRGDLDSLTCSGAGTIDTSAYANLKGTSGCESSGHYPQGWRLIAYESRWGTTSHLTSAGCVPHVYHACAYPGGSVAAANAYTLCCQD
jgi:hypothetical protein